MTARPTVINPTISILDATTLMSRSHFRHLPVSGDIGLVGMLDITDVCRALIDPRTSPSGPPPATPRSRYSQRHSLRLIRRGLGRDHMCRH